MFATRASARREWVGALLGLMLAGGTGAAQGQVTHQDYARAERMLGWNAEELVVDGAVHPQWLGSDRFWYRNQGAENPEYLLVDAARGSRRELFDTRRLVAALTEAADTAYDPRRPSFEDLRLLDGGRSVRFSTGEKRSWTCDVVAYRCVGPDTFPVDTVTQVRSPDGRWLAFEREGNLWVREVETGEEAQLSSDGQADHPYAQPVGCCAQVTSVRLERERRPVVLWSPDSRRLATHRVDLRGVRRMHLIEAQNPGPVLHSYPYALPGDSVIPRYDVYVFDLPTRRGVRMDRAPQDAMGTPLRSKAFHDAYYGDMGDNGLPDHIAAIEQIAAENPQADVSRVGIFGHSGGGFSSTGAILRYPDFFRVAVSSADNHDNRSYNIYWAEKYQGLLTRNADEMDSFDSQSNWRLADRLEGELLLMYGTLDDNVPPNATLLLIDELVKADKDFDLLVLPNRNHGFVSEPYVVRRTWDYFVEHLLGEDPPSGYTITQPARRAGGTD